LLLGAYTELWAFYICIGFILLFAGRASDVLGILYLYMVILLFAGRASGVLGILYLYMVILLFAGRASGVLGILDLYRVYSFICWACIQCIGHFRVV